MKHTKQFGFTLLEILVVIAAMLLISLVTFQSFRNLNNSEALDKEALQVASIIHQAQSLTLASKNSYQYGVHFASSQVTLFTGGTYSSGDSSNVVINLNPAVTLSTISLVGGSSDMVFNRLTGTTDQSGTTTLTLIASTTQTKSVVTYSSGAVDIR